MAWSVLVPKSMLQLTLPFWQGVHDSKDAQRRADGAWVGSMVSEMERKDGSEELGRRQDRQSLGKHMTWW